MHARLDRLGEWHDKFGLINCRKERGERSYCLGTFEPEAIRGCKDDLQGFRPKLLPARNPPYKGKEPLALIIRSSHEN